MRLTTLLLLVVAVCQADTVAGTTEWYMDHCSQAFHVTVNDGVTSTSWSGDGASYCAGMLDAVQAICMDEGRSGINGVSTYVLNQVVREYLQAHPEWLGNYSLALLARTAFRALYPIATPPKKRAAP
jgi:hypothetical protein